jgi:hypothetical protein
MKNTTTILSSLMLVAATAFAQPQTENLLPAQQFISTENPGPLALLGSNGNTGNVLISEFEQNGDKGAHQQMHVRTDPANLEPALEVYPNPSNGLFKLKLPEGVQILSIEVYDMSGKLVFIDKGNVLDVPQDKTIDMSAEDGAVYTVLVRTPLKVFVNRISVIR